MSTINIDNLLANLGEFGKYQKSRFYLLCVPAAFLCSYAAFLQIFILATPVHRCKVSHGDVPLLPNETHHERMLSLALPHEWVLDTYSPSQCQMYVHPEDANFSHPSTWNATGRSDSWNITTCKNGWTYDNTDWDENVVSKFDLVCDRRWVVNTMFTLNNAGSISGLLLFSYLEDRYGRRPTFFVSVAWYVVTGVSYCLVSNWMVLAALMYLKAFAGAACFQIPWILAIELIGPKHHSMMLIVMCAAFAAACVALAGIAYLCRTWIQLTLAVTLPAILLFFYWPFLDESVRWLIATGRVKQAKKLLKKIADTNGTYFDEGNIDGLLAKEKDELDHQKHHVYGMWTIFSTCNLAAKALIMTFIWGTNLIIYYGLTLNLENLGGNQYLTFALTSLVEIPAAIFVLISNRAGRIAPMAFCLMVAGVISVATALVPEDHIGLIILLTTIFKFAITVSFDLVYLVSGILFPTVIRASGMGFTSMLSAIMNIPTPFIIYTAAYMRMLPMLVFGFLGVTAGLMSFLLPETMDEPIIDTLEAGERYRVNMQTFWANATFRYARARAKRVDSDDDEPMPLKRKKEKEFIN